MEGTQEVEWRGRRKMVSEQSGEEGKLEHGVGLGGAKG